MTERVKSFWERHWSWILQLLVFVFSAGVIYATVNEAIKNRPDRSEVSSAIDQKIEKHVQDSKEVYVRIDQVPGLNEKLENINNQLKRIEESNSLIIEKLMKGKN